MTPPKKYEKPLSLDAPFDEAVARFAQTNPQEAEEASAQASDADDPTEVKVTEDERGNICLSALYAMAGKPKNRKPNDWYRGGSRQTSAGGFGQSIDGRFPSIR